MTDVIAKGGDRLEAARQLRAVAEKHPKSYWHPASVSLAHELEASARTLEARNAAGITSNRSPWLWLAESRLPIYIFSYDPPTSKPFDEFAAKNPTDSAVLVVARGRQMIPLLIPLLNDLGPARSQGRDWNEATLLLRVCDVAVALLNHLSGCSFSNNSLSTQPEAARLRTQEEIRQWWAEAENLSFEAGVQKHALLAARRAYLAELASPVMRSRSLRQLQPILGCVADLAMIDRCDLQATLSKPLVRDTFRCHLRETFSGTSASLLAGSMAVRFMIQYGNKREWQIFDWSADFRPVPLKTLPPPAPHNRALHWYLVYQQGAWIPLLY